jgi:antiviral helicase SLH1
MAQGNILSHLGSKYTLPLGTTRQGYEVNSFAVIYIYLIVLCQDFEEVIIPPARLVPPRKTERLIRISELDDLARGSFPVSMHD